ncbi:transcriptional regulator, AlpA family [Duganella sp. CF402]|nr:AlpA family transcriptional regulator [Duganella sp. BK701]SEM31914.1 transcriptional regulator, AlpA family [Duganella sp. CF402]
MQFSTSLKMLRCKQLMARLSLSRSTIYDKLSKSSPRFDPSFPRPINLGPHAVGWVEAEVDAWLQARIAASR